MRSKGDQREKHSTVATSSGVRTGEGNEYSFQQHFGTANYGSAGVAYQHLSAPINYMNHIETV